MGNHAIKQPPAPSSEGKEQSPRSINRQKLKRSRRAQALQLVSTSDTLSRIRPLDLEALGALLNRARTTVQADLKAGRLPPPDFRIGRSPRWRPDSLEAFFAKKAAT